jgi:hypothetical protein
MDASDSAGMKFIESGRPEKRVVAESHMHADKSARNAGPGYF